MKYLVLIHIGPVQAFIASARRSRDLWFGSWVLSELSKAAAKEVLTLGNGNLKTLIFPYPKDEQSQRMNKASIQTYNYSIQVHN